MTLLSGTEVIGKNTQNWSHTELCHTFIDPGFLPFGVYLEHIQLDILLVCNSWLREDHLVTIPAPLSITNTIALYQVQEPLP